MWPFFSSGGSVGAIGEAARGRPAAAPCAPDVGAGGGRRRAVGWVGRGAVRWAGPAGGRVVGWAGQKVVAQWGRGGKSAGKRKRRLGRKARWAESDGENSFLNTN
jgi:hypothetical protein